ncbi:MULTISPECIES: response regulator [Rheinheimera]|jgi:DNA-binding response OmpR family regulator|uniref:Response regulator n=1 Tax=Rheinheimera aquimaris TaxID=412437 RepID=A0ABN1DE45_9GAMM|nr:MULTISPECIES: response regulator [Rheinheimera]MCB5212248.1 response regulator [Rheinheimera aquimaris]MCD1599309.1 response regulator [Rheinheimera aquimaris]HBN90577.1 DNA-binding response regulator [Rheinheimera sp.]
MRLLLVEDDVALRDGLQQALSVQGFAVNSVGTGQQALAAVRSGDCDAVILDLGLPDIDGLSVLKQLRQKQQRMPVLILTARDGIDERIKGLDLGADDYLVKPFAAPELFARLRVIERRLGTASSHLIRCGEVELDTTAMQLQSGGISVSLSRREYVLLKELMESAGRVKTREQLEASLYSWGEEVASNALEVHISNLRKKLPGDFIRTVRGVGYSIARP